MRNYNIEKKREAEKKATCFELIILPQQRERVRFVPISP